MRISASEIATIKAAIGHNIKGPFELYLFGSRADDSKRGGDIDLLLIMDSLPDKNAVLGIKHIVLSEIKDGIGDQKIDLVVAHKDELKEEPFLKNIIKGAIKL